MQEVGRSLEQQQASRIFQYYNWIDKKLNTERYTPKNRRCLRCPDSDYALEADAAKTYKRLMLNDPGFSPKIIEQK